MNPFPAR